MIRDAKKNILLLQIVLYSEFHIKFHKIIYIFIKWLRKFINSFDLFEQF